MTPDEYTITLHEVCGHGWTSWRWTVHGPSSVVLFGRPKHDRSIAMCEAHDATTGGGPMSITVIEGKPWVA